MNNRNINMNPSSPLLEIKFCAKTDLPAAEIAEIDRVSQAAYPPESGEIEWDDSELYALGYIDRGLVSIVGILERTITAGGQAFHAACVGGVATHPTWQRHGYAARLLQEVNGMILQNPAYDCGALFCAPEKIPYYSSLGWRKIQSPVWMLQRAKRVLFDTNFMVLIRPDLVWPAGEIDLNGNPW